MNSRHAIPPNTEEPYVAHVVEPTENAQRETDIFTAQVVESAVTLAPVRVAIHSESVPKIAATENKVDPIVTRPASSQSSLVESLAAPPSVSATLAPQQPKPVARWKKRLLLLFTTVVLIGGIAWATSPRPTLMRNSNELPHSFPEDILSVATQVDVAIDQAIDEAGLEHAERAPWHVIARRTSLAMVGNSLSLEEYRAIEQIPEPERAVWWTEYLLRDRRWADYFAERWTRATVGTNQGPFLIFRRRKYREWLADRFQENLPYDVLVRRLLTAKGSWTDAPEVNFLTATMDSQDNKRPDAVRLAGRTSRAFLALRIDCLQCHQDYLGNVGFTTDDSEKPMRSGEQSDFHQLAAYFSGVRMDNAFVGLQNQKPDYKIKYLHETEETDVEPKVPFDQSLLEHADSTRESLAAWVTHRNNKSFARAAVNRVWATMLGKPLVEPVDSIPLSGPFPPGLDILAEDFAEHGFNIQRLIRIIAATKVFQRDSQLESSEVSDMHEKLWAVFPLTQLRPEQMAASIHQACRLKTIDSTSSIISQLELFGGVNDFTTAYGDRGEDEFHEQSVTIPQRLLVMNGGYIQERIKNNPVLNASTRIANLTKDNRVTVDSAFLAVLNRLPSSTERDEFLTRLEGKAGGDRAEAVGSLYWALLNSTEFQWNH